MSRIDASCRIAAHPSTFALALAVALALPATVAVAMDPSPDGLEEVVVTASLRREAAAAAPLSVTVLGSETLREAGVQHLQDVLALVPNLNWAAGSSRPRYFQLRGIGENDQWQGAPNPSVGFLIDGIDFSGVGMPATLFDVAQIEVLRGPQGAIHGANALAGLINVRTQAATARRDEEPRTEPMSKTAIARERIAPSLLALVSTTALRWRPQFFRQTDGMTIIRLCHIA